MNVRDAAIRLEVSSATIYALVAAGKLRHYRIGAGRGAIRVPDDAIAEYLKAAEVKIAVAPPPTVRAFKHVRLP